MNHRLHAKTCWLSCLALLAAACSFDLKDHPASCKTTSDCARGDVCYEQLCVQGPGGSSTAGVGAGTSAGTSAGTAHAGTHSTGTSGSGSGSGGAGDGSLNVDASMPDMDSAMSMADADTMEVDASMPMGDTLPTCKGWKPSKIPVCPAVCSGGCTDGVCHVACGGVVCVSANIICPKPYACAIACNGTNSCVSATIACGDGPCEVTCTGMNACTSLTLNCGADACAATCDGPRVLTQNGAGSCGAERTACY